ncbi:MAG: ribosomal protein S18-alanine N-acetyltransferase [Actinomycetales bacterium]|nr:ribosomal protein S18-alanine N-acetyltransferase [Actinomycetales bacterium]
MSAKPILRPATADDLAAIMALEISVFGAQAWSEEAMRRDVQDANCVYIVAEVVAETTQFLGYAGLLCPRGSGDGDIQTIAVAPQARGLGLGRALMLVLLQRAEERLAERLFLEVRADNDVAKALYVSLGFEEIAVRPNYYQPEGIDAIVMRREETLCPKRGSGVGAEIFS